MEKIKLVLVLFFLFEIFDIIFTFSGISQYGIRYEKNVFIASLIQSYGFFTVSVFKFGLASAAILVIYYLHLKFRKSYLFYISLLLLIIAVYGVGSNLYMLL